MVIEQVGELLRLPFPPLLVADRDVTSSLQEGTVHPLNITLRRVSTKREAGCHGDGYAKNAQCHGQVGAVVESF